MILTVLYVQYSTGDRVIFGLFNWPMVVSDFTFSETAFKFICIFFHHLYDGILHLKTVSNPDYLSLFLP